jgi:very-short-patch-repair endonuclease
MDTTRARALRKNLTDAERKLWECLRLCQVEGFKFRRQQPLGLFIVDFVCFEKKLILEIDGGQHTEQVLYDSERTRWLESQGFRVLRFWNHDVLQETDVVNEMIRGALLEATPTLTLPHKGGGKH